MPRELELHALVAVLNEPTHGQYISGAGIGLGDVGTIVDLVADGAGLVVEFVTDDGRIRAICEFRREQVLTLNLPSPSPTEAAVLV